MDTVDADQLRALAELRDNGVLTEAEFAQAKATILGTDPAPTTATPSPAPPTATARPKSQEDYWLAIKELMRQQKAGEITAEEFAEARRQLKAERKTGDTTTAPTPAASDASDRRTVPIISGLVLAAVVLFTGYEFLTQGWSPSASQLADLGGVTPNTFETGEYWRLVTANFLHVNIAHVAMNVVFISVLGRSLEARIGHATMLTVVLASGIVAAIASVMVDNAVAVGALGIGFGLMAAGAAIDPKGETELGKEAWGLLPVNVIGTFVIPGLSIGMHIGGLIAGGLVGAAWLYLLRHRPAPQLAGAIITGVVALGLLGSLGNEATATSSPHSSSQRVTYERDDDDLRISEDELERSIVDEGEFGATGSGVYRIEYDATDATCTMDDGEGARWTCIITMQASYPECPDNPDLFEWTDCTQVVSQTQTVIVDEDGVWQSSA